MQNAKLRLSECVRKRGDKLKHADLPMFTSMPIDVGSTPKKPLAERPKLAVHRKTKREIVSHKKSIELQVR